MTLRTLALALASAALMAASPVVEYTFSQPGDSQASTGSSPTALLLRNSANVATDLTGTTVAGVAGAEDRYLDTQTNAGAYGQHGAALAALSGLSQFTFAGWINTGAPKPYIWCRKSDQNQSVNLTQRERACHSARLISRESPRSWSCVRVSCCAKPAS
jgi:hypothetical protein